MSVTLRFNNENTTLTGINVYRSQSAIDLENLPAVHATLSPDATSYTDDTVVLGETYRYVFAAVRNQEVVYSPEQTVVAVKQTGPGPVALSQGDRDMGYYGEVSSASFITGSALAATLELTEGTSINDSTSWLKFAYLGKTLFIPRQPLRHSISWDALDALGLVTGAGEPITIGNQRYRVRLIRGAILSPVPSDPAYDPMVCQASEWNDLMYPTCATDVDSQPIDNWASISEANMGVDFNNGLGTYTWCQESGETADTRLARGYFGITYANTIARDSVSNQNGWRPVLEVVS